VTHDQLRELLSPYLDAELTQADSQRVRIHLEDCPECVTALAQMKEIRRLTGALEFQDPPEDRMDELGQRLSVQMPRRLGWGLILAGLAAWLIYGAAVAISNFRMPTPQEMLAGLIPVGVLLLFISVVRQRLLELPHDRYRRVRK
jgi:anti-sigma factor RsiW